MEFAPAATGQMKMRTFVAIESVPKITSHVTLVVSKRTKFAMELLIALTVPMNSIALVHLKNSDVTMVDAY